MTMGLAAILSHVVLIMPSIAVSVCVESQLLRRVARCSLARTNLPIARNWASLQISSPTFVTLFYVGYYTAVAEKEKLCRAEISGLSE